MVLPYDFNAMRLSLRGHNPQMSNMGMLEIHLNNLVPGGKEVLIVAMKSFDLPTARSVNKATVKYLNGSINYPGQVNEIGDLSVTFYDYIDGRTREILHRWFDLVFDERTGLGRLASELKANAHAVLFGPDGERRASYYMKGIFPQNEPSPPKIDFDNANIVTMDIKFAVDFMFDEVGNNLFQTSGAFGQF